MPSSPPCAPSEAHPAWFAELLGAVPPAEGGSVLCHGRRLMMRRGPLRDEATFDDDQQQTGDRFAFKWAQRRTYASDSVATATRNWLVERYGDLATPAAWAGFGPEPLVLDAGCGAGLTARLLLGPMLDHVRYVGVDISAAVDEAVAALRKAGRRGVFVQADLCALPFPPESFDFILCEGTLHHTPPTRAALLAVARHLKPGGVIAFYVYRRKSPVREFTDDLIRARLRDLPAEEAWRQLMPLTRLGQALGALDVEVDVPEPVPLLGIPAGRISLQRLVYWHFCKMYYRPDYTLEEMNHVNFDWFAPAYAYRHTPEEIAEWCAEAGLQVDSMQVEEAGITTRARRIR